MEFQALLKCFNQLVTIYPITGQVVTTIGAYCNATNEIAEKLMFFIIHQLNGPNLNGIVCHLFAQNIAVTMSNSAKRQ